VTAPTSSAAEPPAPAGTICTTLSVHMTVNDDSTWRQRLGNALRRLADRADGRVTAAVHLQTVPALSARQRADCIRIGMEAMRRAAVDEAYLDALDLILLDVLPSLRERKR